MLPGLLQFSSLMLVFIFFSINSLQFPLSFALVLQSFPCFILQRHPLAISVFLASFPFYFLCICSLPTIHFSQSPRDYLISIYFTPSSESSQSLQSPQFVPPQFSLISFLLTDLFSQTCALSCLDIRAGIT